MEGTLTQHTVHKISSLPHWNSSSNLRNMKRAVVAFNWSWISVTSYYHGLEVTAPNMNCTFPGPSLGVLCLILFSISRSPCSFQVHFLLSTGSFLTQHASTELKKQTQLLFILHYYHSSTGFSSCKLLLLYLNGQTKQVTLHLAFLAVVKQPQLHFNQE